MQKSMIFSFRGMAILLPLTVSVFLTLVLMGLSTGSAAAQEEPQFTSQFRIQDCEFSAFGENPYFNLRPGSRRVYRGTENGQTVGTVATVLASTRIIRLPNIGRVTTAILEERHTEDGTLVEVSKNFFAVCEETRDVFYFGEQVDIFNPDGTVTHEGAWLAGRNGAKPGIIMPGTFLLGARYFNEVAPDVAMDRDENIEMDLDVVTPAGMFRGCVKVLETTPLEPGAESEKTYCPGVGLVVDDVQELISRSPSDD